MGKEDNGEPYVEDFQIKLVEKIPINQRGVGYRSFHKSPEESFNLLQDDHDVYVRIIGMGFQVIWNAYYTKENIQMMARRKAKRFLSDSSGVVVFHVDNFGEDRILCWKVEYHAEKNPQERDALRDSC